MPDRHATWVTEVQGRRPVRALGACALEVVKGPDKGARAAVKQVRFRVGALQGNDLQLKDPSVSGHHFELTLEPLGYRVRDLGSRNGTFVGSTRVLDGYVTSPGVLRAGATEISFQVTDEIVELPASTATSFGPLLGQSVAMRELFAQLERLAAGESTVLVTGETGTGKELVAEALHEAGPRAKGPLVVVDCGALAPTLVESELFGHEKGAFTGATDARAGVFERANGGTVFLDEIGELPLELQPRLLRVLERREVTRLGGKGPVKVDVRVVAATHRELEAEVNKGRFRADLFYRLSVLRVHMPPLRDRLDDVPLLAEHFLQSLKLPGATSLDKAAIDRLQAHAWPGNVRELRNAIERLAHGAAPFTSAPAAAAPAGLSGVAIDLEQPFLLQKEALVNAFERRYAEALLKVSGDNLAAAARKAGLTRMAVVKMLSRLGLAP
ncbi:MAG: sigma 54-interacting transcriptional regulator [Myxococcaceae bacterium]|nr:sigma 54-interacting transcriptional regulator [Myxococcaceae bacterium]